MREDRKKDRNKGRKQKHRITRPLMVRTYTTAVSAGRESWEYPAPSAAIELQFSTGTAGDGTSDVSWVYDLNLASTGGPSARTIVPYSPSVLTFPAVVRPALTRRWTVGNTAPDD